MYLYDRVVINSLIVMYKAKYHKSLPNETPKGSWKKQKILDYFQNHNIPASPVVFKSVIWGNFWKKFEDNMKPIIVSMEEAEGHQFVWYPLHHSYLQYI